MNTTPYTAKNPRPIPLYKEVCDYVDFNDLDVDPELFYIHYDELDWEFREDYPIPDWHLVADAWDKKRRTFFAEHPGASESDFIFSL